MTETKMRLMKPIKTEGGVFTVRSKVPNQKALLGFIKKVPGPDNTETDVVILTRDKGKQISREQIDALKDKPADEVVEILSLRLTVEEWLEIGELLAGPDEQDNKENEATPE